MKALFQSIRAHSVRLIGVGALFMLAACTGVDEMRWKEQVWLHGGQLILIDRYSTRAKSGFPNSRRGAILSQEIRYEPMRVLWKIDGSSEQPISFEVIGEAAYLAVVASQTREKFCVGRSKGEYVAVFYRWIDGKKQTVPQHEMPIERMENNVSGISQWGHDNRSDRTYLSWRDVADATGQRRSGPPVSLQEFFKKRSWLRCA